MYEFFNAAFPWIIMGLAVLFFVSHEDSKEV